MSLVEAGIHSHQTAVAALGDQNAAVEWQRVRDEAGQAGGNLSASTRHTEIIKEVDERRGDGRRMDQHLEVASG